MVRSVAVLSDIHGVLPMLDAVLAEPDVAAADLIVVTGDHAAGPQPTAVLDRLLALGQRALLVCGNADRELVAMGSGP
jgi:predicted phosphodiesterase